MGKIDYRKIYETNKDEWEALTRSHKNMRHFWQGIILIAITPFTFSEHLTKFVIPFAKKRDDGSLVSVSGNEVLTKLEGLTGEILLFLIHIKLLYWVDKKTGKFAKIMLSEA